MHEYRVGMTPASVREVVNNGHEVVMETGAGQLDHLRVHRLWLVESELDRNGSMSASRTGELRFGVGG